MKKLNTIKFYTPNKRFKSIERKELKVTQDSCI